MKQITEERKIDEIDHYETSDLFTEREKVALRYTDAITWNPESADDEMWADLHEHFSEPELVELGYFVGFIAGGQRWIHTLGVEHGKVLFENTVGLSEEVAAELSANKE